MSIQAVETIVPVSGIRIEIVAEIPFARLRQAFEAEVPPIDEELFRRLVAEGAPWQRFARASGGAGVHSFGSFWRHDPSAVMRAGGADRMSVSYLIGDYATTARMFRHDPGTMLYSPLRIELHADRDGKSVLAVDQPSSLLSSFGNNKILQTGRELDRMLGDLIEELGLPRPSVLRR
ncbi:hypothetical protein [Leifsonia poae]|uniref:hypothetical protein n=1 Tax=Leifsonia poae TaxID=110933 RepID=UPI001CBD40F1|nr:hypothetical protein [Leifsonia poae]